MVQVSKRDLILESAGKLFIEYGFQAVSMDQIAAAVPVSKPTLYAHFKDKRELFVAVIALRCHLALTTLRTEMGETLDPDKGLHAFARQFLELLLSKPALQFHRVMMAESESFPEMAQMFYETGPKQMHRLLKSYLERVHEKGYLDIPDPGLSADIFLGMIKGRMHLRCLLGVDKKEVSSAERDRLADTAVAIFLRGHEKSD